MTKSKSKSQSTKATIALLALLPVCGAATWLGRGVFDRLFMLEGQVVVVNATAEDHEINLIFRPEKR